MAPDDLTAPVASDLEEGFAFVLDGRGAGRRVAIDAALSAKIVTSQGFGWLHLGRDLALTRTLLQQSDLDRFVLEALTADETRPRCTVHGEGALVNLRGINVNPGAEPEDMISIRFWLEEHRVIGIWRRHLAAMEDIVAAIERGQAPLTPGDLIARVALRLADRAEPVVALLNEQIDDLEEQVMDPRAAISPLRLSQLRRRAIILRRYLVPQRDALSTLEIEDLSWLTQRDRSHIREAAERVSRLGEDLDAIRDRAQVVYDQIVERRSERMNRQMLLLSIVAAIFLPLGLITGLLGINVGGVPGADTPWAFWVVCAVLAVLAAGLMWWFRRIGMFR